MLCTVGIRAGPPDPDGLDVLDDLPDDSPLGYALGVADVISEHEPPWFTRHSLRDPAPGRRHGE
jgi:hypothetical protein